MDVERAIRSQRVVRRFRDEPLADDDLRAILDAGRRTGSSKNLQRWRLRSVRSRVTLRPAAGEPLSVMWDLAARPRT